MKEHKPRRHEKQKPQHEPEQHERPRGLLTKRREGRYKIWKQHRDDNPGEPKPETGPATQRTSKGGVGPAWKHEADENADRMDSTETTITTAFMAQSYHPTQRHRERAWG